MPASASAAVLERSDGYRFDLSGGRLCLDFTNTVGGRGAPREHLNTYGDLLAWAVASSAVSRGVAARLRRQARRRPAAARRALGRLRLLREALYRVIAAGTAGRRPPRRDLALINARLAGLRMPARLARARRGFRVRDDLDRADLSAVMVPVLRSALEVLTSELDRVRVCADPSCAWLFIDTTRNRARRWCDMKVCGNRSKVRRYREAVKRERAARARRSSRRPSSR